MSNEITGSGGYIPEKYVYAGVFIGSMITVIVIFGKYFI